MYLCIQHRCRRRVSLIKSLHQHLGHRRICYLWFHRVILQVESESVTGNESNQECVLSIETYRVDSHQNPIFTVKDKFISSRPAKTQFRWLTPVHHRLAYAIYLMHDWHLPCCSFSSNIIACLLWWSALHWSIFLLSGSLWVPNYVRFSRWQLLLERNENMVILTLNWW